MKEFLQSNCEKSFVLSTISERNRIDGRGPFDYRNIRIGFGVDRGCCEVSIGNTRVIAQVSCQVETPKQSRPTEGLICVNVELSPMAAPHFEAFPQSDQNVEITRILERCIKESRCVDTESLCIMAGIKVWAIRADIHVLNHEGNLIDACSIAAITALAHFRRPDVTVSGEDVTIHSTEDRDPVPLSVHHMPICVTYAFYNQGKHMLVDPTEKEEGVMEGKLVIAMNKHREICSKQLTGSMRVLTEQVVRCSNMTVVKVTELTELIQKALEADTQARARGEKFGFATSVSKKITTNTKESKDVNIPESMVSDQSDEEMSEEDTSKAEAEDIAASGDKPSSKTKAFSDEEYSKKTDNIISKSSNTVTFGEGGKSTWEVSTPGLTESPKLPSNRKRLQLPEPKNSPATDAMDDEEETTVMVSNAIDTPESHKPLKLKKGKGKFIGGGTVNLASAVRGNKK